jgi:hypothetical protein
MILKRLIGLVFVAALTLSTAAADIVIRVRPPRNVSERRPPRPSRNHVWVSGYHRWDGNAYAWNSGRWEQPPRPRGTWVAARYVRHGNNWVFVEGHWR